MIIEKFSTDLNIISKLGDNPGTDNGLTTDALKKKFDEGPLEIQKYINESIIPALMECSEGTNQVIPTFNLTEMGVPDIPFGSEITVENIDTTELRNALRAGMVKICMRANYRGYVIYAEHIVNGTYVPDSDAFSVSFSGFGYDANSADPAFMWQGALIVGTNYIVAATREVQKAIPGLGSGGAGGTSVQSDWNQNNKAEPDFIKNRPFGETATGGDTLTWDGNTDGKLVIELASNVNAVKVSDAVPTPSDFSNGSIEVLSIGTAYEVSAEDIQDTYNKYGLITTYSILIAPADNFNLPGGTIIVPEKGVWFLHNPEGREYTQSLTINGYTGFPVVKKIDGKYLPDTVATKGFVEQAILEAKDYVEQVIIGGAW